MTKRTPVSAIQNIWFDAQQVDDTDLTTEQNYNNTIESSIINNHVGTGVLPEVLSQNVLFDSMLVGGFFDGTIVHAQNQPSDNNFGNQLEIALTNSNVTTKKSIKIAIIGLDFQGNLQYETFYFKTNEKQVSHRHFTKILLLLFNDFVGDPNLSFNLGGRIVIREVSPFFLSRDPIMVSQNIEPNLFFRDFFVDGFLSLQTLLAAALPTYNVDNLNIFTGVKDNKILLSGDVTTQIGQKFLATTNNIQKITLLLSVRNTELNQENNLVWAGDLIVSIYPLQSTVECPTDIAPNLPIDFSPSNIPIAQLSFNYNSLTALGVVLDSVPQPIDFIFSNSFVAAGTAIVPNNYYAVTVKRSGAANQCDILIGAGGDRTNNSRITTFTGNLWVDLPDEDLWFEVWTDSAKVADGQAYDAGHGMIIPKTAQDPVSLATVDYSLEGLQFSGNDVFRAVAMAVTKESTPVTDQRTGDEVLSRQQFTPQVNLLNTIDLTNLENVTDPLLLGAISDKNVKFFNSVTATIGSNLHSATMANNDLLIRIVDDPTDTNRFDPAVNSLVTNLLNGDLVNAQITLNIDGYSPAVHRVDNAKLCSMILGDVNGDGIIDNDDLDLLNSYLGFDLTIAPPLSTIISTNGSTTTFKNGYLTLIQPFSTLFNVSFQVVDSITGNVVASSDDGVLVSDPNDNRRANFTSSNVSFNTIIGISGYKLVLITPLVDANYGGFDIVSINTTLDVLTIRKIILDGNSIGAMLRADIDGDFHITSNDGYLLNSYLEKVPLTNSPVAPYPGPSTNSYNKIGTRFNVIKLTLGEFVDRTDDYASSPNNRAISVHPSPDIFEDGYFSNHNFFTSPKTFNFVKQLSWDESLIISNSRPKLVSSAFVTANGFIPSLCGPPPAQCNTYPVPLDFDQGRVDYFIPNNLIIGEGGELQRSDGNFYKVDFEVGTIVLEIPDGLFGTEKTINILDDFIADYNNSGTTRLGFPSMRFADCSPVTSDALIKDQIRFSVAVQSFSPNVDGTSIEGYDGVIVDGKIGISIDYATGFLTINFANLYQDAVLKTLSTKIQINIFLKKGGFNNNPLFVDSTKMQNMLKLISVFSGANEGGVSALVDLASDVSGILPIIHGGTGLNSVGSSGTVLVSNGTGLSYQFINSSNVTYSPAVPANWAGLSPTNVTQALDRMAALLVALNAGPIP